MTVVVFILLLLTSPVQDPSQDSVSVEKFSELESRVEELETKQSVRKGYYLDTLSGERTLFATLLTLLVALGGIVGFGVFQWRIQHSEERMSESLEELEKRINQKQSDLEGKLEGYFNDAKRDIERTADNLNNLTDKVLNEHSEIYKTISSIQRSKSNIKKSRSIKFSLKSIRNKVVAKKDNEQDIESDLKTVLMNMRNMYRDEAGIADQHVDEVKSHIREIMEMSNEESQKLCYDLLDAVDELAEIDVLPF